MNGEIAPPEMPDIWQESDEFKVHFLVHTPWEWVMDQLPAHTMVRATSNAELPSSRVPPEATPGITTGTPASRRRRQHRKGLLPCTLKLDFVNPSTGEVDFAVHGTSAALDGVEDKDELVRTIQRCQCVEQNLCPPSVLINWDATKEECLNVVGNELPSLVENTQTKTIAVLKEPMGSQGQGIYFVQSVSEIHEIIDEHHKRANEDPGFLQHLIEVKGRIPSWVLQAEVVPSMLVRDRRKFHVRSYIVIIEKPQGHPDTVDLFVYDEHEIRIAGVPVSDDDTNRDRLAHITNGALSASTERVLLSDIEELNGRRLKEKLEYFISKTFAEHFLSDIQRRVQYGPPRSDGNDTMIRKFAVAGLDLMVTEDERIYLLEANANPGAPSKHTVDDAFTDHLKRFFRDLIDLVVGRPSEHFLPMKDVLATNGT